MRSQRDSDNRYVSRDTLLQPTGACIGGKPFGQQQAGPSLLAAAERRPPPSPSCQPAVHTWQMLRRLAKEDLYLVFDLLEFASILVKERAWLWGRERSQRSQVLLWCIRMMEPTNLTSNSCPLGRHRCCTGAKLKAGWKPDFYTTQITANVSRP